MKGLKQRKRKKEGRKISPNTKFLTVFCKLNDYIGINKKIWIFQFRLERGRNRSLWLILNLMLLAFSEFACTL